MARIAGVDLPDNKRSEIGLTYMFGVGLHTAREILGKAEIDVNTKIGELSSDDIGKLRKIIEKQYVTEGDLRTRISMNIKRHIKTIF